MSLYALVRNSYNPEKDEFRLSESDVEAEGHLDGNLCRCTGYKPILQAAKTFITVDLNGHLTEDSATASSEKEQGINSEVEGSKSNSCGRRPVKSCGRPGRCCRDASSAGSSDAESGSAESTEATSLSSSDSFMKVTITQEPKPDDTVSGASYAKPVKSKEDKPDEKTGVEGKKTVTGLDAAPSGTTNGIPQFDFKPYEPTTELIFPPSLWKFEKAPLCYGNEKKLWFRPISLKQLVELKAAYPSAKLVAGASEVQVEVRFKGSDFAVSVYISDIDELHVTKVPELRAEVEAMDELVIGANTPLACALLERREVRYLLANHSLLVWIEVVPNA